MNRSGQPTRSSTRTPSGSLEDPFVLPSSSSRAATEEETSQASDNGSSSARKPRSQAIPWTSEDVYKYVEIIKNNPAYQASLLKGHKKKPNGNERDDKISQNTYYKAISRIGNLGRNLDQMRQKLAWVHSKYQLEIDAMSQTGRGLLLSDMRSGTIKNAREQLLKKYSWFDMYHEMMRDRASSDPDFLVTGKGVLQLSSTDDEESMDFEDGDDGPEEDETADELMGDDGPDGLNLLTQAALRAEIRRYNRDTDSNDSFSEEQPSDSDNRPSLNTATPRARPPNRRSSPINNGRQLPTLGSLAQDSQDDPMYRGSNSASRGSSSASRLGSPGPSSRSTSHPSKGKAPVRPPTASDTAKSTPSKNASPGPSTQEAKGKAPIRGSTTPKRSANGKSKLSDSVANEFDRFYEERQHRTEVVARASIEKEHTKRFRLELKSQAAEKQADVFDRQMTSLQTRMDSMNIMINTISSQLASINAHIGTMSRKVDTLVPSSSNPAAQP
ncbi:hypothetical protein A4X13_0g8188 [Tilletia indica]|uniref:Uncharacterized protein n=1 Tax=Tilletia indica TaxID=43049 RepID=A0A8T8SFU3_9BASI|nr:hypothetical protein A4X13_0g8188 [Tilletia indica]